MAYLRIDKSSSYFSRFQVKYRRRRESKTDYRARLRLVTQDKNKYGSHKYRMVVRFTNRDIICQVVYSAIVGDKVLCYAYAHELPDYGLKVGLTNYSASYCVGLLCARRCLTKFGLDKVYSGVQEVTGEKFSVNQATVNESRPFTVILDTGIKRTSTGSKVFAVMKGAVDGGLNIPHNEKRYVGYDNITKVYNPEIMKKYIFGGRVSEFMEELMEEEPHQYARQFSQYVRNQIEAENLEAMFKQVHEAIQREPNKPKVEKVKTVMFPRRFKIVKKSLAEKKSSLKEKICKMLKQ